MKRLENKVAVVTGGANGIGRATALRLADEGADIVIADVEMEPAREVANKIRALGRKALVVKVDVTRMKDTEKLASAVINKFGKIDILCNIAGGPAPEQVPFNEKKEEVWTRVIALNLLGQLNVTRSIINYMIKQKYGKILNMASSAAMLGMVNMVDYSTAKGGVISFTRALAKETVKYNINVNSISPGATMTRGVAQFPERIEELATINGMGRVARPEEMAALIAFLVSDEASFITGQNYPIMGLLNLGQG